MTDEYQHVLGLDTATSLQAVALLDGERALEDCKRRVAYDHASSLLANIDDGFEEHDLSIADVDLIACGIGPGSFTGVRISLSLAKGLARAHDIPLVGVSSLAALTYPHAITRPVDYVIGAYDARRQEVYTATYQYDDGELATIDEDRISTPAEVRERALDLAAEQKRVQILGNGAEQFDELAAVKHPRVQVLPAWTQGPSGVACAQLGRQKILADGPDDLHHLEPNYIRKSSAEENYESGS